MMGPAVATVTVDLAKIVHNARQLTTLLDPVRIVGVTKVTCGSPEVANAMLAGGAVAIGESRLENIERLRDAGVTAPMWLIRSPVPALAEDTVRLADVSLESESATLEALDAAAARAGTRHRVVVMVDLGDLREGVMPLELPALLERASTLGNVEIAGVGTSLTCYGAIVPSRENLGRLVELARSAETSVGHDLEVSGGMSSSLDLAFSGGLPDGIANLRVGESIVLGVSTVTREPLPGLHADAVILEAPVIECAVKPSLPVGESAQDAFGGRPEFQDRGLRRRAICAIGRQDVAPEGLRPIDPRVEVLGASSDHLICDVHSLPVAPSVGDTIAFVPNYSATLRLFTSSYVRKRYTD